MSPLAIMACASSSGTHRTSAVSSTCGAPACTAPRARYSSCGKSALPDHRLAGQHVLDAPRPPASFLLDLACRRGGRVLAVIDVTARQLPHPAAHDEPVPPHQQHLFTRIIQHDRHRAAPHPEHVLGEAHLVGQPHIGQADPDVRGIVYQPLAADQPRMGVRHQPTVPRWRGDHRCSAPVWRACLAAGHACGVSLA